MTTQCYFVVGTSISFPKGGMWEEMKRTPYCVLGVPRPGYAGTTPYQFDIHIIIVTIPLRRCKDKRFITVLKVSRNLGNIPLKPT